MAISEQKKQYVVRMQSNAVTNWKNRASRVEKVKLNIRFSASCKGDKNAREPRTRVCTRNGMYEGHIGCMKKLLRVVRVK